jgi:hypothetical protein
MWRRRNALLAVVAAAALLSIASVHGYDFVPITSLYYGGPSTGSSAGDSGKCLSSGGYLATEATAVLHEADISAIHDAIGTTADFYAYLGGGINMQRFKQGGVSGFCPWIESDPEAPKSMPAWDTGKDDDCLYRWRVGRWELMTSDVGATADEQHAGVAFYKGQNIFTTSPYGFPTWWLTSGFERPSVLKGRYVVLFQNSETGATPEAPRWTDNYGLGGYTYANGISFSAAVSATTLQYFHIVCQNQGPFRLNYEDPRASTPQKSQLQNVWWVIFLVILFVLCLIAFLIIACCQEREDMDEPPEDAPEWAETETAERSVSKRYVSQRSFESRSFDDDDDVDHADSQGYCDRDDGDDDNETKDLSA